MVVLANPIKFVRTGFVSAKQSGLLAQEHVSLCSQTSNIVGGVGYRAPLVSPAHKAFVPCNVNWVRHTVPGLVSTLLTATNTAVVVAQLAPLEHRAATALVSRSHS